MAPLLSSCSLCGSVDKAQGEELVPSLGGEAGVTSAACLVPLDLED